MRYFIAFDQVSLADRIVVGGKSIALKRMDLAGLPIPQSACISTQAYRHFIETTGLGDRIMLELMRKNIKEMRWEEIWDASLRIFNMFVNTPWPQELHEALAQPIADYFGSQPLCVRSSAPDEDAQGQSFAGLHKSYINIQGVSAVIDHIKRVWASLWSDAALLYREELGLDAAKSAMAVLLQQFIHGDCSGIVFTQNPNNITQGVLEAVHGLNDGLVDGDVEPDRWTFDRSSGALLTHQAAARRHQSVPRRTGSRLEVLPLESRNAAPLDPPSVSKIFNRCKSLETLLNAPQDVEWTQKGERFVILQARPITALGGKDENDKRSWYLSLHRSFANLEQLHQKIEDQIIPGMMAAAQSLSKMDLQPLSDQQLVEEIDARMQLNSKWVNIYWKDCIPFAHGVRLFGQVYNDVVSPEDPHEFVLLLGQTPLASMRRNQMLFDMAALVRQKENLRQGLAKSAYQRDDSEFEAKLSEFMQEFGNLSCSIGDIVQCNEGPDAILNLVREMALQPAPPIPTQDSKDVKGLADDFIQKCQNRHGLDGASLLDLARASYRLRDDDNIYLGQIEAHLHAAVAEAQKRVDTAQKQGKPVSKALRESVLALSTSQKKADERPASPVERARRLYPRQMVGQPAGPGIARGTARVISQPADLLKVKSGEVLVCDAVDPNMTFVMPLSTGIVERRGGMLIHGAIIAREYGLPCVTGISRATELIQNGDLVTVDGYLGIVTIGEAAV
jgi:pyruvate,water dikinase